MYNKTITKHMQETEPLELLLEYAMCGLAHNNRDTSLAKQWYNEVKSNNQSAWKDKRI